MQCMAKLFPLIPCKNNKNPCDSCRFLKLKKLSFRNSITHTHAPFELLHADLWGPFAIDSILGHMYFLTLVGHFQGLHGSLFLRKNLKQNKVKCTLLP